MGSDSGSRRRLHQPLCLGPGLSQDTAKRMKTLASHLLEPHQFRVFSDSAPVLEKHLPNKRDWLDRQHTLIYPRIRAVGAFWLAF